MCRLKIIGELAKSGYTKFEYEGNFLHSSLKYSDQFLIPEVESIDDIFNFNEQKTFTRPTINTIDNYLDLGDKKYIVSDAGILFSIHGKLEHKLLDFDNILSDEIKIILEKTFIGTLNAPFEITSCHLISIDSSF